MYWLIWSAQVFRTWLPLHSGSWHRACGVVRLWLRRYGGEGKLYFVGELPGENCRGVFVSVDDFADVVFEGFDDGRVGVEFCL